MPVGLFKLYKTFGLSEGQISIKFYSYPNVILFCQENETIDWNQKNPAGETPLMICLKQDQLTMFKILSEFPSIDFTIPDESGKTLKDHARFLCFC